MSSLLGQGRDCHRHKGVCDCQRSNGVDDSLDRGDGDQGRGDVETLQSCSSTCQGPVSRAHLLVQLCLQHAENHMAKREAGTAETEVRWGLLKASLQ